MTKEEYLKNRNELMDKAQALISDRALIDAEAVMVQVEALDKEWDAVRENEANMNALNNAAPVQNVSDPGADAGNETAAKLLTKIIVPVENFNINEREVKDMNVNITPENAWKSDIYTKAWAKNLMNKPMSEEEAKVFEMAETYTHTTGNTGAVVPETVANGIWSEIEDAYPYYADITKTTVSGILTIIKSTESSDAAWYDEDTETEDGKETFETFQLNGCELARAITVSWKLKEMAVDEFIPYIQTRMAERMGAALGYGIMNGAGPDADKPEPTGLIPYLESDGGQVVETDEIAYKDITAARAKIKSGYSNGLAIYANSETIWGQLANIVDGNGHPLFIADPAGEDGVYRCLGLRVKEDSSVGTGYVVFSNAARGYQANINKQISVVTEDHAKTRTTDYVAYGIIDGAPITAKAHALIKVAGAEPASAKPASANADDSANEVATASAKTTSKKTATEG